MFNRFRSKGSDEGILLLYYRVNNIKNVIIKLYEYYFVKKMKKIVQSN